jgi:hypothetical protein
VGSQVTNEDVRRAEDDDQPVLVALDVEDDPVL